MSDVELNNIGYKEGLEDITKCVLCTKAFQEPSTSLCDHKFCMRCLQQLAEKLKRSRGDEIPCPICGKGFLIPEDGLDVFEKNVLMDNCKSIADVSVCDSCLEDQSLSEKELPFAEVYCTDCDQKFCKECHRYHLKIKSSKSHRVVNLEDQHKSVLKESSINLNMPGLCPLHSKKPLDIFCFTCSEAVCSMCFIDSHKSHECTSVFTMVSDFLESINEKDRDLSEFVPKLQQKRLKLEEDKAKFIDQISELEIEIIECKEDLKGLLEEHSQSLLMQLKTTRETSLKSMGTCIEDIERLLTRMESFRAFCKMLLSVAASRNICEALESLKKRAFELREQCHSELEDGFEFKNIWLTRTITQETLDSYGVNLIGKLEDLRVSESGAVLFESDNESFTTECTEGESCAMAKSAPESLEDFNQLKESNVLLLYQIQELVADKFDLTKKVKDLEQVVFCFQRSDHDISNKELTPCKDNSSLSRLDCGEYFGNHSLERLDVDVQAAVPVVFNEPITSVNDISRHVPTIGSLNYKNGGKSLVKFNSISKSSEFWKISGLAILEEEFFLAVKTPNTTVEIYDLESFLFKRRWTHRKLYIVRDMKPCKIKKCLYVMNETARHASNEIIRFDLSGILLSFWSIEYSYGQLSVTSDATVLFTSWNKNEITEYRSDGQQVRVIPLSWNYGFSHASHAIKLNSNIIVVSHGNGRDPMQRICKIDTNGKVLACESKFKTPIYMDKDRFDNLLVVDSRNRFLKILDSSLNIISAKFYTPIRPNRLNKAIIDETYRRVFVVECQRSQNRRNMAVEDTCQDLLTVLTMDPV